MTILESLNVTRFGLAWRLTATVAVCLAFVPVGVWATLHGLAFLPAVVVGGTLVGRAAGVLLFGDGVRVTGRAIRRAARRVCDLAGYVAREMCIVELLFLGMGAVAVVAAVIVLVAG